MLELLLNAALLLLLGVTLLLSARFVRRAGSQRFIEPHAVSFNLLGWVCVLVSGFGPVQALVGAAWGLTLWVAGFIVAAIVAGRYRLAQQESMLWVLALSLENNQPLTGLALDEQGRFARRIQILVDRIQAGEALDDALYRTRGLVPRWARTAVWVGSQTGTLPQTLRGLLSETDDQDPLWRSIVGKIVYLSLSLGMLQSVTMFALIYITPKFQKIFEDVDVELPGLTGLMIDLVKLPGAYSFLVIMVVGTNLAVLYGVIRYLGWIEWDLPWIMRLGRRLHTAFILRLLAPAVAAGQPLPVALSALSHSYPQRWIRRRLERVAAAVEAGEDWLEQLLRQRLIGRADVAVLSSAIRAGNLPWALREMAESNERRFAYRMQLAVHLLFSLLVIGFGILTMFWVLAMFVPLVELISLGTRW